MTKQRNKFKATVVVEELIAVPFVTDVLFCKVRLRNGGTYSGCTKRENVSNHSVYWQQRFQFTCKISTNGFTGVLEPCLTRLSIRKEIRGGRSTSKIGFVDLNLSEFAGSSQKRKHCLLEGYNTKTRLNNSILKVMVTMQMLSGDPLFKTPSAQRDVSLGLSGEQSDVCPSLADTNSSGFGSLSRTSPLKTLDETDSFSLGHSRNLSSASHVSKRSDYSSHHSRTPSSCSHSSQKSNVKDKDATLVRSASSTTYTGKYPLLRSSTFQSNDIISNRMSDTRISAEDIVSKLIESQDFSHSTNASESDNLQLYVGSDGSTALGGQNLNHRIESGLYHAVVFETKAKSRTRLFKS